MKFKNLFLISALAGMVSACSNSDEIGQPNPNETKGESAIISLQISGTTEKAAGDPSQEEIILRLDAFIFNADGSLEATKTVTSPVNSIQSVENVAVTTGTKKILVLANYTGTTSNVKNAADLQSLLTDLANEKDRGRLTMSTELVTVSIKSGKNYLGYVSVPTDGTALDPEALPLVRFASRIKINNMQWQSSEYTFEEPTAMVVNATKSTSIIQNTTSPIAYTYYQALAGAGDLYPTASTVLSGSDNFLSSPATNNATYFYVYENQPVNDVIYPTMVVIRAKVKDKSGNYIVNIPGRVDANSYTYYPVIINKTGTGTTITGATDGHKYIKKNNTYNISTVVKGLGTINPFSSEAPSSLSVQMTVSAWALNIQQTQIFE